MSLKGNLSAGLGQVRALQTRGDTAGAILLCERLVDSSSRDPAAVHFLGLLHKAQGRLDSAEGLLRESLESGPQRPDYLANLGNLLVAAGRAREGEDCYRDSLALDPAFGPARIALGRLLCRAGRFEQALSVLESLKGTVSHGPEVLVLMGDARRGLEDLAGAKQAFRQAIAANPNYGPARHNLGTLLLDEGEFEASLDELTRARMECGVRGSQVEINRARALSACGRSREAEEVMRRCVQLNPGSLQSQLMLARLRHMQGVDDFSRYFRRAARRQPGRRELQLAYATLLRSAGRLDQASQHLDECLQRNPGQPDLLLESANCHQLAGRYMEALGAARAAGGADNAGVTDATVDALLSLGRADEAFPLILEARQRFPDRQRLHAAAAVAARILDHPLYHQLFDYDHLVRIVDLPCPDGWGSLAEFNRDLARQLRRQHVFRGPPLDQSLRNGTQTPASLLRMTQPVIRQLLTSFKQAVSDYARDLAVDQQHPMAPARRGRSVFAGCWSVQLHRHGYHVNHIHSQGTVSSAYYVELPDECGDQDQRSGWLQLGAPRHPVPGVSADRFVQPRPGRLVLFPSYLWHGTTPITGSSPRLTVAFDVRFGSVP